MDNHLPSLPLPDVGDRVKAQLYPAEVVKCRNTGEYAVVYETDRTVGRFVTHEEHRLLPLEEKEEGVETDEEEGEVAAVQKKPADRKKRVCYMEGCTKGVIVRGSCVKHGAYGMCLIGDCTTMAVNKSQRCYKHGAVGLCTVPGCATNAQNRGLCSKHGGGSQSVCVHNVHPGCTTKAAARGLCKKHGGGNPKALCVHPGCTTKAHARGLCNKHGGDARSVCVHPGCTTKAKAQGLCAKHGGTDGLCVCIRDAPPKRKHKDSASSTAAETNSNHATHPIVPPPQRHTGSAGSTVHLGCAQNQTAPSKCKPEDGARSTTTCSTVNSSLLFLIHYTLKKKKMFIIMLFSKTATFIKNLLKQCR
jgi:hypothetical protein